MPHIVVKMYKGRTSEQKQLMSEKLAAAVRESLGVDDSTISIACEEYDKADWPEEVYRPEIYDDMDRLLKKPGYNPLGS